MQKKLIMIEQNVENNKNPISKDARVIIQKVPI
jgi:hypothetical protein